MARRVQDIPIDERAKHQASGDAYALRIPQNRLDEFVEWANQGAVPGDYVVCFHGVDWTIYFNDENAAFSARIKWE